uniref:C2H2-type domain-containing protein n=1 Tax=Meloidogyne hapla TaxID=6305 RepID=A0A1I8BKH1_MELHA
MEVSNEHGYGSNIYEMNLIPGLVKKTTSNDPLPFFNIDSNKNIKNRSSLPPTKTSKQNNKTNKPVRYFISDSNPGGQDSTLSLADLRGFTSTWKTPVKCLICSRRFSHIWHLAFHLVILIKNF